MRLHLYDKVIVAVHELIAQHVADRAVQRAYDSMDTENSSVMTDPQPAYIEDTINKHAYLIGLCDHESGTWLWCAPCDDDASDVVPPTWYSVCQIAGILIKAEMLGDCLIRTSDAILQYIESRA